MAYDFNTFTFTADFAALPEGNYQLRLISGDGAFEDSVGNDLDGDPGPTGDGTPTGNGSPGTDYVVSFLVDRSGTPVTIAPFERLDLVGSLVAVSRGNSGFLNFAGDADPFAFEAEAGSTMSYRRGAWEQRVDHVHHLPRHDGHRGGAGRDGHLVNCRRPFQRTGFGRRRWRRRIGLSTGHLSERQHRRVGRTRDATISLDDSALAIRRRSPVCWGGNGHRQRW